MGDLSNYLVSKIDGSKHLSFKDLHAHIKRFRLPNGGKIQLKDYYEENFPRKDLATGAKIEYKGDPEAYFSKEFKDKTSLKKYITDKPVEGKEWMIRFLTNRRLEKNLIYAPSSVELRSLFCPNQQFYDKMFEKEGGYYQLCQNLGFKSRYKVIKDLDKYLDKNLLGDDVFAAKSENSYLIQDTREQKPIKFPKYQVKVEKLDVGDYGLCPKLDKGIYIDRKELNDFCGTLSAKNLPRFEREIIRAQKSGSYLIMAVESTLSDALSFDYLPQTRHVKASPAYIFKNLRDLLNKYPLSFQVVFFDGRIQMAEKIVKILELGCKVKEIDLQYHLDTKLF